MTEERLRGRVSYGKTVNLGNYNSARVDWSEDFFLDDGVPIEVLTLQLKDRLEKWLKENGLTV